MSKTTQSFEIPSAPNMHTDQARYEAWEKENAARWEQRPCIIFRADDGKGEEMETAMRLAFAEWTPEVDAWIGQVAAKLAIHWSHVSIETVPGILKKGTKAEDRS